MAESFGPSHRDALNFPREVGVVPDTCDIDIAWELDATEVLVVLDDDALSPDRARAMMPTLHEEDPLRHDLAYRREHAARDSMPTLPDIDPLSYDVPDEG